MNYKNQFSVYKPINYNLYDPYYNNYYNNITTNYLPPTLNVLQNLLSGSSLIEI